MNLKRLRDSSSVSSELNHAGYSTISKSVGGYLIESPLDYVPESGDSSPQSESQLNSDCESDLDDPCPSHPSKIPRSRSLTLPFKVQASSAPDDMEGNAAIAGSFSYRDSPSRLTSNPITITSPPKPKARKYRYADFPMTDGALAEFAALSSTPLSGSEYLV